jgi:hypothetical protein
MKRSLTLIRLSTWRQFGKNLEAIIGDKPVSPHPQQERRSTAMLSLLRRARLLMMCPDVKVLQPGETPQKLVQKFPPVVG